MLISYSSWFDNISNAFLYPVYPAALVELKSNPYKLVFVIYSPICFTTCGPIPSSPPWKGIVNLTSLAVGPVVPVVSNEALNDFGVDAPASPAHKLELVCPKQLSTLNTATKTNLATYLEQYRMLTDAINIKNAFVVNFAIEFEITVYKNYNNDDVLLNAIAELKDYFNINKWQINQPIIVSDVKNTIGAVRGVQTVEDVRFKNEYGIDSNYSQYKYSIDGATRNGVIYPSMDPSIFELKYPDTDIKGQVTTY